MERLGPGVGWLVLLAAGSGVPGLEARAAAQEAGQRYRIQVAGTVRAPGGAGTARDVRSSGSLRMTREGGRLVVELEGLEDLIPVARLEGPRRSPSFTVLARAPGAAEDIVRLQGNLDSGKLKATLVRSGPEGAVPSGDPLAVLRVTGRRTTSEAAREARDARESTPVEVERPDPVMITPTVQVETGGRTGDGELPVEFELVDIEPAHPTAAQRVRIGVLANPTPPHEIERIVVRVGDAEHYGRPGERRFDRTLGPFDPGSHEIEILAEGPGNRTSRTVRREFRVRAAGSAVIRGRITGETELVTEVQLLDGDRRVVERTTPDRRGRYRFERLLAGTYRVHVAAGGKRDDVRIEGGSNARVRVDGESHYTRDFRVSCRRPGCG